MGAQTRRSSRWATLWLPPLVLVAGAAGACKRSPSQESTGGSQVAPMARSDSRTLAHRTTMPNPGERQPSDSAALSVDACGGLTARLATLRGWATYTGPWSNDGQENEAHYAFQPDVADLISRGLDPASLFHWGNLYESCQNSEPQKASIPGSDCLSNGTWWAVAAPANIHVELSGWNQTLEVVHAGMGQCSGAYPPSGWVESGLFLKERPREKVFFPFDPLYAEDTYGGVARLPDGSLADMAKGQYVEMEGSVLADHSHCHGDASQELRKVKQYWARMGICDQAMTTGFGDQSRWIEIHPPDRITLVPESVASSYSRWWLVGAASPYAQQELHGVLALPDRPDGDFVINYEVRELQHDKPDLIYATYDRVANGISVNVFGKPGGTPGSEYVDGPRYLALVGASWTACTRHCDEGSCGISDGCDRAACKDGDVCSNNHCCPAGSTWSNGACVAGPGCDPYPNDSSCPAAKNCLCCRTSHGAPVCAANSRQCDKLTPCH
jgi:hypothetical protein